MSKFETHQSSNDDENIFRCFTEPMACTPISNTERVRDHLKTLLEIHENYALGAKNHSITSNLNQPKQKV